MKNIFISSNIKNILGKSIIGKNTNNKVMSVKGLTQAMGCIVYAVLALSVYKAIGAHAEGEVVSATKEIRSSSDHIFKLVHPLHFRVNGGTIDFVNIHDFSDTIPSNTVNIPNRKSPFENFIHHKNPFENFNEEFSDKEIVSKQLEIFYEKHADVLREQYGISDIRNLTPKKIVILAQFVTQNIVEYGSYFESLDAISRYDTSYKGIIAGAKLHSWYNVGNSLIGVDTILKKMNEKNMQTNGICHNYAAVFKTVMDVLVSMQGSHYIKDSLACTTTTSAGTLMSNNISDIEKHVWNTCYYRSTEDTLQVVIIDVTVSDSTDFKLDANMDYTGERFLNEIWRFRNNAQDTNNSIIMNGIQDISLQIQDDMHHVPKDRSIYRNYVKILKTIDIMNNN